MLQIGSESTLITSAGDSERQPLETRAEPLSLSLTRFYPPPSELKGITASAAA